MNKQYGMTASKAELNSGSCSVERLVGELERLENEATVMLDCMLDMDLPKYSDCGDIGAAYYQNSFSALNAVRRSIGNLRAQLAYY